MICFRNPIGRKGIMKKSDKTGCSVEMQVRINIDSFGFGERHYDSRKKDGGKNDSNFQYMSNLLTKILKAALIVGTLDIIASFIHYFLKTGDNPFNILKFIASGVMGEEAFTGDALVFVSGLILHYFIALLFTAWFFWLFPSLFFILKNKIITGIIYGVFIWAVMSLLVVPLSRIPSGPINIANAVITAAILIVCIGIPLSFMAEAYYKNQSTNIQGKK
jgi:hypothetical protein